MREPMLEAGEWFSPSKLGAVRARCVRCGLLGLRDSLLAVAALLSTRISCPAHSARRSSSASTCSAVASAFAPLDRLLRAILAQLALLDSGASDKHSTSSCDCRENLQACAQNAF